MEVTDDAAFKRASAGLLERLSIPDRGGKILSAEVVPRTIAGRCQREVVIPQISVHCADEALEMYMTPERAAGLNFK